MTDKPTQKEMDDLFVEETGFDPDDFPAAIFGFTRAALAKWGQPAQAAEPVAWKHDCAALLTNDVELWIDACPHCGKPRNAPKPVGRVPLTDEQIKDLQDDGVFLGACRQIVRAIEAAHGIKGGQHVD